MYAQGDEDLSCGGSGITSKHNAEGPESLGIGCGHGLRICPLKKLDRRGANFIALAHLRQKY